jgi:hypothetical protein
MEKYGQIVLRCVKDTVWLVVRCAKPLAKNHARQPAKSPAKPHAKNPAKQPAK